jgi:hypothetical protein
MQLWDDIEERLFMISEPFKHLDRIMSEFGNTGIQASNPSTDDKQASRLRMQQMYSAEDKLKAKTAGSTDLLDSELISESALLEEADDICRLRIAFEQADIDGRGALNQNEFVDAFLPVLGADAGDVHLLFMRIDADSDGTVTWEEFLSYVLSQGSEPAKYSNSRIESDHVPVEPHNLDAATSAGRKQSSFSSSSIFSLPFSSSPSSPTFSSSPSSPTKNAHRSWASLGSCTDRSSI